MGVCMLMCNLPPELLVEWPGSFTWHCGNRGVERTPYKSPHTQLTLEKKILLPLLRRFELSTFWSLVWHSYQQAVPALYIACDPRRRSNNSSSCSSWFYCFLRENATMWFLVSLGYPRSQDSLLVRVLDLWSKGCKFQSWQGQWENFLLHS